MDPDQAARAAVLARLAHSRAEITQILDPPPEEPDGQNSHSGFGFPRSRTMRALMSKGGLGTVGAVVGGLVLARPALAFRLLRMLPAGAVSRMLIGKAIGAFTSRRRP